MIHKQKQIHQDLYQLARFPFLLLLPDIKMKNFYHIATHIYDIWHMNRFAYQLIVTLQQQAMNALMSDTLQLIHDQFHFSRNLNKAYKSLFTNTIAPLLSIF